MDQLIVFLKNPVKGKVKTRLAATLGDDKALEIYLQLSEYTLEIAEQSNAEVNIFLSDEMIGEYSTIKKYVQKGSDLGERMNDSFVNILKSNQKAIIIGSDCIELTTEMINQAFEKLNGFDLVIGPALDGGYYLLGMKKPFPEIFRNIEWSTSNVFDETIRIAKQHGKSIFILPVLRDIDTEEDWNTLKDKLK